MIHLLRFFIVIGLGGIIFGVGAYTGSVAAISIAVGFCLLMVGLSAIITSEITSAIEDASKKSP